MTRAASRPNPTRDRRAKAEAALAAALGVLAARGLPRRPSRPDRRGGGLWKPNLLPCFASKDAAHHAPLDRWLEPLRAIGPQAEIRAHLRRKLVMARDFPRESRLFADEMRQGAPRLAWTLASPCLHWSTRRPKRSAPSRRGGIMPVDPRHLILSIWAATRHHADFDAQAGAVLGSDALASSATSSAGRRKQAPGAKVNGSAPRPSPCL